MICCNFFYSGDMEAKKAVGEDYIQGDKKSEWVLFPDYNSFKSLLIICLQIKLSKLGLAGYRLVVTEQTTVKCYLFVK